MVLHLASNQLKGTSEVLEEKLRKMGFIKIENQQVSVLRGYFLTTIVAYLTIFAKGLIFH